MKNYWHLHIGDSTQPHKKYAGTVKNCDFVIVVNFYTKSKTFWIFCVLIISVCKHSDFKFEGKQKCFQYVKNIPKKRVQPHFSQYFAHIKKILFAQSLKKSLSWNWKKKVEKKLKLKKKVLKVRVKIEKTKKPEMNNDTGKWRGVGSEQK